jgi:hypothetical protein
MDEAQAVSPAVESAPRGGSSSLATRARQRAATLFLGRVEVVVDGRPFVRFVPADHVARLARGASFVRFLAGLGAGAAASRQQDQQHPNHRCYCACTPHRTRPYRLDKASSARKFLLSNSADGAGCVVPPPAFALPT